MNADFADTRRTNLSAPVAARTICASAAAAADPEPERTVGVTDKPARELAITYRDFGNLLF